MRRNSDTAGVLAAPPLLFGAAWAAARLLHAVKPMEISRRQRAALRRAGWAAVLAGSAISAAVVREFHKAATAVSPYHATSNLAVGGPYRFSRNPDYIGQTLIYSGSALVANSWWPLMLLPPVLAAVQRGVIEREERYLDRRFGDTYRRYARRVRRWL